MPGTFQEYLSTSQSLSGQFIKTKLGRRSIEEDDKTPLKIKENFTLGCDPEGFVFDCKRNVPVAASLFIPGTKHEPHKVDKGAVQVDGLAAEFNIDPASTYEEWEDNISNVIAQLQGFLPKGHEIRWVPSVKFAPEDFDPVPEEHKLLGCSPDFDAWSGSPNPVPYYEDPYVRVAGGHIHFGWTKDEDLSDQQHLLTCQDFGKQCDFFLGGWGSFADPDTVRPNLYGKMGAIRYKPYGMEYRVLSNFWVATKDLRRIAWDRACKAIECMAKVYMPDRVPKNYTDLLRAAILTHQPHQDLLYSCKFPLMTLHTGANRW